MDKKFLTFDNNTGEFTFVDEIDLTVPGPLVLGLHWFMPETVYAVYKVNEFTKVEGFIRDYASQSIWFNSRQVARRTA